jgi:hypothetical protein
VDGQEQARVIDILVNDVTVEGNRRVKAVSDSRIDADSLPVPIVRSANVHTWSDESLGLHYLEATWQCREAILVRVGEWKCARKMVLWKLEPGERVSEALKQAVAAYGQRFKCFPDYAFMRKLPKTIEDGFEVDDVTLLVSSWVPAGCVAVCKGDDHGFEAMALQE